MAPTVAQVGACALRSSCVCPRWPAAASLSSFFFASISCTPSVNVLGLAPQACRRAWWTASRGLVRHTGMAIWPRVAPSAFQRMALLLLRELYFAVGTFRFQLFGPACPGQDGPMSSETVAEIFFGMCVGATLLSSSRHGFGLRCAGLCWAWAGRRVDFSFATLGAATPIER